MTLITFSNSVTVTRGLGLSVTSATNGVVFHQALIDICLKFGSAT